MKRHYDQESFQLGALTIADSLSILVMVRDRQAWAGAVAWRYILLLRKQGDERETGERLGQPGLGLRDFKAHPQ